MYVVSCQYDIYWYINVTQNMYTYIKGTRNEFDVFLLISGWINSAFLLSPVGTVQTENIICQ